MPTSQHPDDIIGRILPESLHKYFFFDGERIEQIVRYDKKAEIAEATKELLGVEVLNRSIRHLLDAKKSLETDLKIVGNAESKKLLTEQDKCEIEIEKLSLRQVEIEGELASQGELKRAISGSLLELSGAGDLQKLRDELEMQKSLFKQQIVQATDALKRAISMRGYGVFLLDAATEFQVIFEDLRQKRRVAFGDSKAVSLRVISEEKVYLRCGISGGF
jgi:hypothetical protein